MPPLHQNGWINPLVVRGVRRVSVNAMWRLKPKATRHVYALAQNATGLSSPVSATATPRTASASARNRSKGSPATVSQLANVAQGYKNEQVPEDSTFVHGRIIGESEFKLLTVLTKDGTERQHEANSGLARESNQSWHSCCNSTNQGEKAGLADNGRVVSEPNKRWVLLTSTIRGPLCRARQAY
jgi:hypothetical protein